MHTEPSHASVQACVFVYMRVYVWFRVPEYHGVKALGADATEYPQ